MIENDKKKWQMGRKKKDRSFLLNWQVMKHLTGRWAAGEEGRESGGGKGRIKEEKSRKERKGSCSNVRLGWK